MRCLGPRAAATPLEGADDCGIPASIAEQELIRIAQQGRDVSQINRSTGGALHPVEISPSNDLDRLLPRARSPTPVRVAEQRGRAGRAVSTSISPADVVTCQSALLAQHLRADLERRRGRNGLLGLSVRGAETAD